MSKCTPKTGFISKKPVMRNLLHRAIFKASGSLSLAFTLSALAAIGFTVFSKMPRMAAYAEYYRVTDPELIFKDIAKKDYFKSVRPEDV